VATALERAERVLGEAEVVKLPVAAYSDARGRILPVRLGEAIREAGHVCTGFDGRLWRYSRGAYRNDGEQFVRAQIREMLGDDFGRRLVEEVLTYLRSFLPTVTNEPQRRYLNVANGLLDLQTCELKAHSASVISTVQVPVAWVPEATCPAIDAYLTSTLPEDAVAFVLEVVGYALYPGNPFRKAVLLLGPGGNGKSVFLRLVVALLGAANCAHVALQSLGENRFAAASLFGRLANVCGDLDARAIKRTDLFKQVTGGDEIFAEHKGRDPFSFTSIALPIFSANEAPVSSDQSQAWFDRWLIVPMERRFEGTPAEDPHLSDKLTARGELEGLIVRAVDSLRALMARGHFVLPPSVESAGSRYRDTLDSARGFVGEMCLLHPESWVARPELYRSYRRWCQDSGRMPVAADRFNDHLRKSYPMRVSETTRRGTRGWQGIGLVALGREA